MMAMLRIDSRCCIPFNVSWRLAAGMVASGHGGAAVPEGRPPRSGVFGRLLSRVSVYPFRCQLCGRRFRAIQPGRRWVAQAPERREFDRLVARVPVGLSAGTLASEGAVTQISMEGCTLETDAVLPVGTVLQVRLHLPDARALAEIGRA